MVLIFVSLLGIEIYLFFSGRTVFLIWTSAIEFFPGRKISLLLIFSYFWLVGQGHFRYDSDEGEHGSELFVCS